MSEPSHVLLEGGLSNNSGASLVYAGRGRQVSGGISRVSIQGLPGVRGELVLQSEDRLDGGE